MKLHRYLALAAGLLLATAANAEIKQFVPTGPSLIEGAHLNQMVDQLNGTNPYPNSLIGTGANKVSLSGGATTVDPVITVGGSSSDTNIGLLITGKGTGPVHIGGSDKNNGSLRVPTVASAVNAVSVSGAVTTGIPFITVGGLQSDTNASLAVYGKGTGSVLIGDSSTTLAGLQVAKTTSAVNGLLVTPGATGTTASISSATAGADTNVGITMATKGTGAYNFSTNTNVQQFGITNTASAVDYIACTGSAAGNPGTPTCTTTGSDTNINFVLATKGSGNVKLGASVATCSGTTTATCQGQRFVVSITGLTTAASTLSAAMTVTDANVVSSSSLVQCQVNGYSGTGVPVAVNVTPGTGSVALNIQNVSTGAALNATVPVACVVFGG